MQGSLEEWLLPNQTKQVADVYAIGFQEIVDLNAMNVALDGMNFYSVYSFISQL